MVEMMSDVSFLGLELSSSLCREAQSLGSLLPERRGEMEGPSSKET